MIEVFKINQLQIVKRESQVHVLERNKSRLLKYQGKNQVHFPGRNRSRLPNYQGKGQAHFPGRNKKRQLVLHCDR